MKNEKKKKKNIMTIELIISGILWVKTEKKKVITERKWAEFGKQIFFQNGEYLKKKSKKINYDDFCKMSFREKRSKSKDHVCYLYIIHLSLSILRQSSFSSCLSFTMGHRRWKDILHG